MRVCRDCFLTLALILTLVGGCEEYAPPPPNVTEDMLRRPAGGHIAFLAAGKDDPIWPILRTGAEHHRQLSMGMPVQFLEPAGNTPRHQADLLNSLDDPSLRGLCIQINDVTPLRPALNRLYNRGVAIVSILKPAPDLLRVAHVGVDDTEIGEQLAAVTRTALDGQGQIMVMHNGIDAPVYGARLIAFREQLRYDTGIDVLADFDCQANPLEARRIMRDYKIRYPRLSAWVSMGDWPVRNAVNVGELLPAGCKIVLFGGTPEQWIWLRNGSTPALVAANYRQLGRKALLYCESAVREPSESKPIYNAPLRVVWPTQLEDYIRDWRYWSTGELPRTTESPFAISPEPIRPSAVPN